MITQYEGSVWAETGEVCECQTGATDVLWVPQMCCGCLRCHFVGVTWHDIAGGRDVIDLGFTR